MQFPIGCTCQLSTVTPCPQIVLRCITLFANVEFESREGTQQNLTAVRIGLSLGTCVHPARCEFVDSSFSNVARFFPPFAVQVVCGS